MAKSALLLDFDGTLADSLGVMRSAYCAFLARYAIAPSDREFAEINGPPLAQGVAFLCCRHGLELSPAAALETYNEAIESVMESIRPSHGAASVLETARALGWRTGIVTSNRRSRVEAWLAARGLAPLVDCVIGDEITPGKPGPAPYIQALERLGCLARDSLAVEDSAQGRMAAAAAGLRVLFYQPLDRPLDAETLESETLESLPTLLFLLRKEARPVRMRLATEDDKPFLFSLRNDPSIVANCLTPRRLDATELEERFADDPSLTAKITLVTLSENMRTAMVRFDAADDGYAISLVVEKNLRGRGFGTLSLQAGMDALQAMRGPQIFYADVADDNASSAFAFHRCGFAQIGRDGRFLHFARSADGGAGIC